MINEKLQTQVCIAGGGPSGMMLGFLLARAGIETVVLEKHADFFRDFRGDTIHPSTLELMHELGLAEEFLKLPHQKAKQLRGLIGDSEPITVADFSRLPVRSRFIALMPQWDFLNFIADQGRRFKTFHLRMQGDVTGLIEEDGRVAGVRAESPTGLIEVRASLVVGADGRRSIVREKAGLVVEDLGAPIDVLWMRVPRKPTDPEVPFGRFGTGRLMALIYRGDYWQCAYVIPKDGYDVVRKKGLDFLRKDMGSLIPFLKGSVDVLQSWEDVKLLTVKVDRLREWYREGVLCIGDAAHAMSPLGGVGINLAVQDAVAAANILERPLIEGKLDLADLRAVQKRRIFPTWITQRIQVIAQNRIIRRVLEGDKPLNVPAPLKWPIFPHLTARVIGLGVRPEHIRTSER